MFGLLGGFMALGLPVAFAFIGANVVGAYVFLGGEAGLSQFMRNTMASLTNFALLPIPFFILMGEILFHTGLAFRAISAIERLITRLPGRLSLIAILSGTVFASLTGSTIANTALLGSVLMPAMLRRGYHPSMAMGPIMATGGIAILIPPSALAVLLGSLVAAVGGPMAAGQLSISKLLVAGIVPGLLLAAVFFGYVVLRCALRPDLAPAENVEPVHGWARWGPFLRHVLPLFAIVVAVIGSILSGWATPTEAAALGALASLAIALGARLANWRNLSQAVMATVKISVMILFIIGASQTFSQVLAFSGASSGLLGHLLSADPSPLAVVLIMLGVLLVLGAFMDPVSMMLITLPFFVPAALAVGIDLLWLGVLMLIVLEVSFTTPPFGLLLYVMKGVAPPEITLMQIFAAAMPFILLALAVLGLIVVFPVLAVWLPETLLD